MKLDGYAIVTGGARGIGKEICLQLAQEGYDVVVNYVSPGSQAKANQIVEEMQKKYGVRGLAVRGDIGKPDECKMIIEEAVAGLGEKIAILINNAGVVLPITFAETTPEQIENVINVDLKGALYCTYYAFPYMKKLQASTIVNVSSVAGLNGRGHPAYSAAKAGVIGTTKAMAKEFAEYNIRVNCCAPGCILTDMILPYGEARLDNMKKDTPLGIIGDPKDVADCVLYLVNAKFVTGQVISPNGGAVIV